MRSRPKARSAGVFTSPFLLGLGDPPAPPASCSDFGRGEIRVEFLQDFVAGALDIDFQILEHAGSHAFAFAQQAQQDVLGADVGVVERLGLLAGERQHFLYPRRVGDVADHLGLRAAADLFLDFHADGLQIEPHLLEHVHRHALAELDQPEQQVLGAHVIVVEPVGFLTGQSQTCCALGVKLFIIWLLAASVRRSRGYALYPALGTVSTSHG